MTERRTSSGLEQIRILHLYDEYLNIYADRGNIMVLQQRCAWREIACHVTGLAPGETFTAGDYDLIYVGGGQDRDQRMIAQRMVDDCGNSIVDSVESGAALLAVCGGYQLLGHSYRDTSGEFQPGVGLFDLVTEAGAGRLIGNVEIEVSLPDIGSAMDAHTVRVAGFENHAGRTSLRDGAEPLGRVVRGNGNDGISGYEGCRRLRALGTYLHGPLLPRNPELADWLIAAALHHAGGNEAAALINRPVPELVDSTAVRARTILASRP